MKRPAKTTIFNSFISILLCAVMIAGATMALFAHKADVNIAVTSGNIAVTATPTLTAASSAKWDDTKGAYEDVSCLEDGKAKFLPGGTASVDGGNVKLDKIMPGDSATIEIKIANSSTIDIKYQLTAEFKDEGLLNALNIGLTCNENADLQIFDGQNSGEKLSKWQTLGANASSDETTVATLSLTIAFPMDFSLDYMKYAGAKANIKLTVNAVQGNAHTEDPTMPEAEEVGPDHAQVIIKAADEGQYKILEAETKTEDGHEFLYWAFEKSSASRTAARLASSRTGTQTPYGIYLTNNPTYKFRVTAETYGTYQAVYRIAQNNSKVVRLNESTTTYTVTAGDVGSTVTLIAEEATWAKFDHFLRWTKDTGDTVVGTETEDFSYMYKFEVKQEDIGASYTAVYDPFNLGDPYADYFDNTGAIDYEAHIVNDNVERNIPNKYECGGIDGEFTVGEFAGAGSEFKDELYEIALDDYPIYGKGYTNYKSNEINKNPEKKTQYTKLNKAVFAETTELSQFGNFYFMDEEGKLWGEKEYTAEEALTLYAVLQEEFTKEHGLPDGFFDEDNWEKYQQEYENYYELQNEFTGIVLDKMQHGGTVWMNYGYLYKHPESQNMYLGDVDPEQDAVEKKISATARGTTQGWSPTITGLYAPAGEVITFKMSEEDMLRTGGMIVTIGMVQMPGLPLSFGVEKYPVRPARIIAQTTITPNTKHPDWSNTQDENGNYVFYFGSYLGGPIYVSPVNPGERFTIDISGAVEYQHYIYGVTTEDQFVARQNTTAPYFECWVSTEDVRFVGPYSQVKTLNYENFVKVSRLWENAARISKRFPSQSNSEYGIMLMFETYVQSGAACAFAGANTVDAPYGWMGGALGYESIVEAGGWGNFHEFNHCYQYFGIGADSEVSNNTVNLVEYALLTEISAHRDVDANGISTRYKGWESYTDPAFTLRVLTGGNPSDGSRDKNLCRYVNLFYSFGLDRYVEMTQITSHNGGQIWGSSKGAYPFFKGACEGSGYNMEYYFNEILFPENDAAYKNYHINLEDSYVKEDYEEEYSNRPTFVPVACTYQTGVGYAFDPSTGKGVDTRTRTGNVQWEYTTTSRPFRIDFDQTSFTLDFEKTLALPGRIKNDNGNGWKDTQFTWSIECTGNPTYGTVVKGGEGRNFIYTIDGNARKAGTSGRMVFTVTYTGMENTVAAGINGSVQIVIQFDAKPGTIRDYEQLDRTTYTFAEGIEEDKESEGGEGSESVATVAEPAPETRSPFEIEYDNWTSKLGNYDGTFNGALYVTTEPNTLPAGKESENNTAVYFDEDLHPAPADSFVVISGIYTPKENGTYYLGIESGHKAAALYISTDGKLYTLHVTASQNPGNGGLYQDGSVIKVAKQYKFEKDKPVYFREVLAIDPEATDNHVKMIWGAENCAVDALKDHPTGDAENAGCAYCVKDNTKSYELEYLETRDQYIIEKTTATQTKVEDVTVSGGFTIFKDNLPGFVPSYPDNFFDEDPYNPFRVDGSSGELTIIGKMSGPVTAESFTIRTDADNDPHSYKLFVSKTNNFTDENLVFEQNWDTYGSRPRLQRTGTLEHSFNDGQREFQYYKLEITKTGGKLILYGIEFGTRWNMKQPSDRDVEKLGTWDNVRTNGSTFGYLLTAHGSAGEQKPFSSLSMTFTGTQLHIRALTGATYGAVEILLDGECFDVDLRRATNGWFDILSEEFLKEERLAKLQELLDAKTEHTLVLRSTESFNVDAIYYR